MRFGKALAVLLAILLSSAAVLAQQQQQQQQRYPIIAGISVEGLTLGDDMQTVIAYSGLRIGAEARPDDLVAAVKNLWNRRTFADVRIEKERETALGIFLVIRVVPMPRLRTLTIVGNDDVAKSEIEKAIGKVRGDIVSPYDLYVIRQSVKKLYESEGMLFARVEAELASADSGIYNDLTVTIDEGAEYSVEAIEFEGNDVHSDDELASAFEDTKTKAWWQFWKSNTFDLKKYEADKEKLKAWFLDNGLIDAELVDDTVIFHDDRSTVTLRLTVKEGPEVFIRSIRFAGNTVYDADVLTRRLGIDTGIRYNASTFTQNLQMNADQSDVASLYMDNGYLTARMVPDFVRVSPDSVDVVINVFEGERFTIRRVEIVGNNKTRDRVIRRELFTRPGDFFSRSAMIRSIRGLGVLNYFNQEALNQPPQITPVDKTQVDLTYKVEERSTDTFNASVGFAGAFGLTGSVGVTLNNFDITEPLRGGGGQIMSFQWEFGQASRLQTFQLSFTEPWLMGQPTTVGFNLYDTRQNFNISVRRTGASLNVGRRFRFPDDYFRGDWALSFERIESNTNSFFSRAGTNTALTLSQTFSRTSFDNIIFPTSGSRFVLSTRLTTGFLGIGTTDFAKLGFTFDMVNPLVNINNYPRLVLFLGSEMGFVDGLKSDTTIPPQELYYMGGNGLGGFAITPLRGYRDNIIGPLDATGRALGGRVQARFTAELRFALSLNPFPIYLLSFAEAGNVWESLRTADPFGLKRAAGVGMRLLLQPIGLLGFDLGYGFDPDPATGQRSGWRFHFQFGR